jgi:DNA-binding response OmpR family regulator
MTILVVEDDVLVRLAVAEHLRECGYRVLETGSAEDARAVFETREPVDVMFSDVQLAGRWSGTDLAAWVRERFPLVKVILTSGAFLAIAAAGCDLFVAKPYVPEEIVSRIKTLLRT